MMNCPLVRRLAFLAVLAAPFALALAGCSSEGTTPDKAPTAPPVTAESNKDLTDSINAGAGPGGMKSPGVTPKK